MAPPFAPARPPLVTLGVLIAATAVMVLPPAASAQDDPPAGESPGEAACAATGYVVGSEEELAALRAALSEQSVHQVDGVPLRSGQTWVVPDGGRPVVVVDSTRSDPGAGAVSVSLAGQEYEVGSTAAAASQRQVADPLLPHLGPVVRSLGLRVQSGGCDVAVALAVDRRVWSTLAGGAALAVAVLFGLLTVLVARLRRGGWRRRFGFAAPFGLVAGLGQAVVLLESGVVGPFDRFPWWAPVAGLGLAALLPLTRWRRRTGPAGGGTGPAAVGPPPAQAPLGGYRIDEPVTGTAVAGVYRATRVAAAGDPGPPGRAEADRALLKVASATRYGEPATRLRLEREAGVLEGVDHPQLLRLRETVPSAAGPPTLVFADADATPLGRLFDSGGSLSGPQAVTVAVGVLAGLQAVHERGLVHRDVRPENVWLTPDGRVLLGGFELACAGLEHPLAPEGTAPYASPEQRAGQVLDGRSDLYAVGVLLVLLLTGQAPPGAVPSAGPPPAGPLGGLPEPLARVLAGALAADPAARADSAAQLAAQLGEAATHTFEADWVGRGALAGALATHVATGAAAAGYTLAGGAGTGAGLGGPPGTAGLGASAAGTTGAAGTSAVAGGAVAAAPGVAGPAAVVANAAVAVLAGAAVAVAGVLVDPRPADAAPLLVTPGLARVIFISTVDELRVEQDRHLDEEVAHVAGDLRNAVEEVIGATLVDVEVGVPRDQRAYPAWFVAVGQLSFDDGAVHLFSRFDRAAADEPWLMTSLSWYEEDIGRPLLDGAGWLVPPPDPADLVVDPADLPQRYADWHSASFEAGELVEDELLTPRELGDDLQTITEYRLASVEGTPDRLSIAQEILLDEAEPTVVWLADGFALVSFTVTSYQLNYNSPVAGESQPCPVGGLFRWTPHPEDDFRLLSYYGIVQVVAWVPARGPGAVPPVVRFADPRPTQYLDRDRSIVC